MTLQIGDVLNRLEKVSRSGSGSGWTALCPAHDDSSPSLTVAEGQEGRVLLNCHRGCEFDAIAEALGLEPGAFMGEAGDDSANGNAQPTEAVRPPSEHYVYEDARGTPLFRVSRYYVRDERTGEWKKRFAQGGYVGEGRGYKGSGYKKNMEGVDRTVYNLPAVRAAVETGEPVFIVEGEKDVHALRSVGIVATTNPGGAGKWEHGFNRLFAEADVVIVPDNDEAGRQHAGRVRAGVSTYARSVVLLDLTEATPPISAEKGDVSDWLRIGGTRAELLRMAGAARSRASARHDVRLDEFDGDLGIKRRPLFDLPQVSQEAINALPGVLRGACGHYRSGAERGVVLSSALALVSGILPNVRIDHYDRYYMPHIMFSLIARTGGGKGLLEHAAWLCDGVDRAIREQAIYEQEAWDYEKSQLKRGQHMDRPRPFPLSYYLPANASKTYLLKAVAAAGEPACIMETEIDTLVGANAQEWGDFSDLIRKAFHHERYMMGRVGGGDGDLTVIEEPSLALAISGTYGQFRRLFEGGTENGFFNRFAFFVSNEHPSFRSQRPGRSTDERRYWFADAARDLTDLFRTLKARERPLIVVLRDKQWDEVDALFEPEFDRAKDHPFSESLLGLVQRSNLIAVRVAAVLTVLRAWEQRMDLAALKTIRPNDVDLRLALHIASVWYAHGYALLTNLVSGGEEEPNPLAALTDGCRELFDCLSVQFERAEANACGEAVGVKERTVKKYLRDLQEAGLIVLDGRTYTKVPTVDASRPFSDDDLATD